MHPTADTLHFISSQRLGAAGDAGRWAASGIDMKKALLAGVILCGFMAAPLNAQRPVVRKGGEFCEGYLLRKVAKEKGVAGRVIELKAFNADDGTLPDELKEWLQTGVHPDMLTAFRLRHRGKSVLLLRGNVAGATGLAGSFNNWYVQLGSRPVMFRSLAENPRLIFWDKGGLLNYYLVTYTGGFAVNRDWDNVAFDLQRYRVGPGGKLRLLIEERNVKCQ